MLKWVLGLVLLLLGSELSYAAWLNTNASTRSYRTISSTHHYAIAPTLSVSISLNSGDIIYVAVVGGSDSSDTIVSPTYNTPYFDAALSTVNAIAPTSWSTINATKQPVTLNAVLKITVRQTPSTTTINAFLSQLSLKTMAYRQDKTIAFILDRTSAAPTWRCFNARTVSVNFNIQCSTTHGNTYTGNDVDNDIAPQDLVSFSPNEFLAFDTPGTARAANTCPFSTYEKELHSTHQTMATYLVSTTQVLSYDGTTFTLTDRGTSFTCGSKEYTTANQADDTGNTIYARMVIMRPNPFLHAQPF